MKRLLAGAVGVALAGVAVAGLERAVPVGGVVGLLAPLPSIGWVDGEVPEIAPLARLAACEVGAREGLANLAQRELAAVGGDERYASLGEVAADEDDALLPPVEIWAGGPLGELRRAAREAAAAGDAERYREVAARYWKGMETALERRRMAGESAAEP